MCLCVYECALLERWVYFLCYVPCISLFLPIKYYFLNATALQPQRTILKYFAIIKSVAHNLEPGKPPSYSASHQAPNYVQRSFKHPLN